MHNEACAELYGYSHAEGTSAPAKDESALRARIEIA